MTLKNTYVDDILNSVNSMRDAIRLVDEVEALLAIGGFKLKNWIYSEDHNKSIDIRNAVVSPSSKVRKGTGYVMGCSSRCLQISSESEFLFEKRKKYTAENVLTLEDLKFDCPYVLTISCK